MVDYFNDMLGLNNYVYGMVALSIVKGVNLALYMYIHIKFFCFDGGGGHNFPLETRQHNRRPCSYCSVTGLSPK